MAAWFWMLKRRVIMNDAVKIAEYNRVINSKRCNNYDDLREVLDNTGKVYLWGGKKMFRL